MRILVTAGNTQTPIDRVRCLTNIFTGRTGAAIALTAFDRGHTVALLTSHPDAASAPAAPSDTSRWRTLPYRTFIDLESLMADEITTGQYDALVHCAAVGDYQAGGIYAPAPGTHFLPSEGRWSGAPPTLVDRAAGKVKSDEPELWLRLVRAPKLADRVRGQWSFEGVFVKFKLEVGVGDQQLLESAEQSRLQSRADLMTANTLEGMHDWAFLGPIQGGYRRVGRSELPQQLLMAIEGKWKERPHG